MEAFFKKIYNATKDTFSELTAEEKTRLLLKVARQYGKTNKVKLPRHTLQEIRVEDIIKI